MAEVTKVAKAELKLLLEKLGHTFVAHPFRKVVSRRLCFRAECSGCGEEWHLRFSENPRNGHAKLAADFPALGERCRKAKRIRDEAEEARIYEQTLALHYR